MPRGIGLCPRHNGRRGTIGHVATCRITRALEHERGEQRAHMDEREGGTRFFAASFLDLIDIVARSLFFCLPLPSLTCRRVIFRTVSRYIASTLVNTERRLTRFDRHVIRVSFRGGPESSVCNGYGFYFFFLLASTTKKILSSRSFLKILLTATIYTDC